MSDDDLQTPIPKSALEAAKNVTTLLITGDFDTLRALRVFDRVAESDLQRVVAEYGCTLTPIPATAWSEIFVMDFGDQGDAWAVDIPLWTIEEGKSDLMLCLIVRQVATGVPSVDISDLLVA